MRMLNTPHGDYYIGDVVDAGDSRLFVNSIIDGFGLSRPPDSFILLLTDEFHPAWTGSYLGISNRNVNDLPAVISRGNYYRRAHGLPLEPFDTPMNEAHFYFDMEDASLVDNRKVFSTKQLLQLIRNGTFDGYFLTEATMIVHAISWHGVIMKDRMLGRELAKRTLTYHHPFRRLWKRIHGFPRAA